MAPGVENDTRDISASASGESEGRGPQSDAEILESWASSRKISGECLTMLAKQGFTSMEAMALLDQDDLSTTKVPRGQQKLLLRAVGELRETLHGPQAAENDLQGQRGSGQFRHEPAEGRPLTRSRSAEATQEASASTVHDSYVAEVLQSLQTGQAGVPTTVSGNGHTTFMQNFLQETALDPARQQNAAQGMVGTSSSSVMGQASWQDPQIHLRNSAGKPPNYLDIVDFLGNEADMPEEVVMDTKNGPQLVLRTNSRKPKLENITLSQWSIANVAILHSLMTQGASMTSIADYLSHTTRIYQLIGKFTLQSVFLYDRAYRKSQAQHGFRWGTELAHLQLCFLQARPLQSRPNAGNGPARQGHPNIAQQGQERRLGPRTSQGKEICKQFNSQSGCRFTDCRFQHVCSVAKCEKPHSAIRHDDVSVPVAKN